MSLHELIRLAKLTKNTGKCITLRRTSGAVFPKFSTDRTH